MVEEKEGCGGVMGRQLAKRTEQGTRSLALVRRWTRISPLYEHCRSQWSVLTKHLQPQYCWTNCSSIRITRPAKPTPSNLGLRAAHRREVRPVSKGHSSDRIEERERTDSFKVTSTRSRHTQPSDLAFSFRSPNQISAIRPTHPHPLTPVQIVPHALLQTHIDAARSGMDSERVGLTVR